jgi:predicted Zn-dependent protease
LRLKSAPLALAACLVLNLAALPPAPADAQVRLPALGEAEADQFSIADEKRLGEQIMREIRRDPDVVDDPVLYEYLQSIFQRLVQAAKARGNISPEMEAAFGWEPFLVRDRSFNAFALPGGWVGVHLGLIAAAGSRDEMASVLGHELSHITQRHIARSMVANKHQSLVTVAAMLLGLIASSAARNGDIPAAIIATGQASMATGQLTFSRQMESEADRFGLDVMTDAGFAPSGMAAMFERLEAASQLNDDNSYPWLRSHPLTIDRLAEARLRARSVAPPDPRESHLAEHALMRARARVLMDGSEPALRRMQAQARLTIPMNDAERLGALYGGALASVGLRDFAQADAMIAAAQELLAQHAARAAAPPASAASAAGAAPVYPIEPVVARDFELLRVEYAIARRSNPDIAAAGAALGADRSRPAMIARAESAIARAAGRDPGAAPALQRSTEELQTWVAEHPHDALAWATLARSAEPLGLRLRAIRADAEAHAAQGDLTGAIDRLRTGQGQTRGERADFVESSIIDSRLRELEAERRALQRELRGDVGGP